MNSVADLAAAWTAKLSEPLRLPPDALESARARCVTHGVPVMQVLEIERQAYAAGFWAGAAAGAEAAADIVARMTEAAK